MPFTLSHAAAAWPFRHTRLVMSALIIGCFAPDFEYFIPFQHHGSFGHSWLGVFVLDLPLSLIVLWLFHRYAKQPLAACLPDSARARLQLGPRNLAISPPSRIALIVLSIFIGILTHLFWDSFTHAGYWTTNHLHFLSLSVTLPLFGPRHLYEILQYFSSAFGIVVMLLWGLYWYRHATAVPSTRTPRSLKTDRIAIGSAFLIAVILACIRAVAIAVPHGVHGAQHFMTILAITAISVFCFLIVIYGIVRDHTRQA
jgi:hypothetical protein